VVSVHKIQTEKDRKKVKHGGSNLYPSYSGDRDQKHYSLSPAQAKNSQDPISINGWAQKHIPDTLSIWGGINRRIVV
jgi:hypothetical protein